MGTVSKLQAPEHRLLISFWPMLMDKPNDNLTLLPFFLHALI